MSDVFILLCPSCSAPYSGTPELCIYCRRSGEANTLMCATCSYSWSYSSDLAVYACWDHAKKDLNDPNESDSESGIKPGISELKRMIAKQESRIAFMNLLFDTERGCGDLKRDVSFVVEGREEEPFHAHKFVLSSKSPVFCKMFAAKLLQGETEFVKIYDATLPVMRAVIKFCYSAEINFSGEVSAEEVLEAAHKFSIEHLQETCEEYLITTIDVRNLPRRLNLATKLTAMNLKIAATAYLKTHFDILIWEVLEELRSP